MCIWQLLLNLKIQTELIRVNVLTLLYLVVSCLLPHFPFEEILFQLVDVMYNVCTLRAEVSLLHMAFSICKVFAWLVCPVVGLLRHANDFVKLSHTREKPVLAGYVMSVG